MPARCGRCMNAMSCRRARSPTWCFAAKIRWRNSRRWCQHTLTLSALGRAEARHGLRGRLTHMRTVLFPIAVGSLVLMAAGIVSVTSVGPQPDGSFLVPTGQTITPAGIHIEVADRPLGMALSPDGNLLAVVTGSNFASRRIHLIDVRAGSIAQSIAIGDSFVGVAFSADGQTLYVGGGLDHNIKIYRKDGAQFRQDALVPIAASAPSGLSLAPGGDTLYVALNLKHTVAILDTRTRTVVEAPVGTYPYTTAVTRDGSKIYVSNWGGRRPQPDDATNGIVPVVVDPKTGIANSGTLSILDAASRS